MGKREGEELIQEEVQNLVEAFQKTEGQKGGANRCFQPRGRGTIPLCSWVVVNLLRDGGGCTGVGNFAHLLTDSVLYLWRCHNCSPCPWNIGTLEQALFLPLSPLPSSLTPYLLCLVLSETEFY